MSTADIPIDKIDESTLQRLIDDEDVEQLRLEYKEKLAFDTNDEKKEFLRDVSSFANTAGGDILFGIREEQGKPVEIVGLSIDNPDKLKLQLESMIRDGLEPKLSGHMVHPVCLQPGKYVIVVRIPRSYAAPHRVALRKSTPQFWARRSNGKYPLEINELRNAFLLSETAAEKIRGFRVDRVGKLLAGQGPVILDKGPKLILHLIPLDAFQTGRFVNINSMKDQLLNLRAIGWEDPQSAPNYNRFNLDGFLVSDRNHDDPNQVFVYSQWFRNGIIESVTSLWSDKQRLEWEIFEDSLPKWVKRALEVQKQLGVQLPIVALLTVCDVKNFKMVIERSYSARHPEFLHPIDRDHLLIPEVLIDSFEADLQTVLRPMIDAVWNAAGYPQSPVKQQS